MTRPRAQGSAKVIVALVVFTALGFLIYQVFHDPSNPCTEVLPQDKRVGLSVKTLGKDDVTIDLSGQRGVPAGATPQQIDAFVRCLEATGKRVVIENGVRIPLEPVGQVANRWRQEPGVQLRLMPGSNDVALQNLGIGPATGLKEYVIRTWCSQQRACVSCEPDQPAADGVEVIVRLRDGAPLEKRQFSGLWPGSAPGAQQELWQLVNTKGERFYFECRTPLG